MILSRMNKYIGVAMAVAMVVSVTACGGSKKKNNATNTKATAATTRETQAPTEKETTPEERASVHMTIAVKNNGLIVRILDENNEVIEGVPFTVCVYQPHGSTLLDIEKSNEVNGREYTDAEGAGFVEITDLPGGSYEVYLRTISGYQDAMPKAISYAKFGYDEDVLAKIKQSYQVDRKKEDRYYQLIDSTAKIKRDNAVKFSNIVNSGFILGTSKPFTVNVPILSEDDEIQYTKLYVKEVGNTLSINEYTTESNKEELLIDGQKVTGYVVQEMRFDKRIDDTYVAEALIKMDGKYMLCGLYPRMKTSREDVYVGWYSKKGKHYYNDEDGYPASGWCKVDGLWYYFDEDGQKMSVTGIDISEYQEEIDWALLKDSGIDFVIIRCAFRGWGSGVLVEDARFKENIRKATEYEIPFGVYIFSQAINQFEAAEEASVILNLCKGYEPTLPYAIDIEACGDADGPGRQNKITSEVRTQVINAFVDVIESQGEEAMLYSNKSWLENDMDLSKIHCKLWYALWPGEDGIDTTGKAENTAPNRDAFEKDPKKVPNIPVEIWQYSSKGIVDGIEPLVDLNAWIPEQAK